MLQDKFKFNMRHYNTHDEDIVDWWEFDILWMDEQFFCEVFHGRAGEFDVKEGKYDMLP